MLTADLAGREGVGDDPQGVDEAILRLWPVAVEPLVLDRRDAAADAEVEPTVGEVVDDAHVLDATHMCSMIRTG